MKVLSRLVQWINSGSEEKPQRRNRFQPSLESLERRECPALYEWTYPLSGPSFEESAFNLQAWRVNGVVPTELPGEADDLFFGAGAPAMDCRIGSANLTIRNIIIDAAYTATLNVRWGWTLTLKDGANSLLEGGWIELSGRFIEGGPDNHSQGNIVLQNSTVTWTRTYFGGAFTIPPIPHEYNRVGTVTIGQGSNLILTGGVSRNAWAEWIIQGSFLMNPGVSGGVHFGVDGKVYNDLTGLIRWSNDGTEGSFFVLPGNLNNLINFGRIEREAAFGNVLVRFPVVNLGTVSLISGGLTLDPLRTEAWSLEGNGRLKMGLGTTLVAPDGVYVYGGGIIELTAGDSSVNAVIIGVVNVDGSGIDLSAVEPLGFSAHLDAGTWNLTESWVVTRTSIEGEFVYANSLVAFEAINLGPMCHLTVYTFGDPTTVLGVKFPILSTRTILGDIWDGPIFGDFETFDALWNVNGIWGEWLYEWGIGQRTLKAVLTV